MTTWDPAQYLKYARERTMPSRDLVARIATRQPRTVLDVGCGPGNSTAILAECWPDADIMGIDSSQRMIGQAEGRRPDLSWQVRDAGGDLSDLGCFDVVFSNAALQWIPDHDRLIPSLYRLVAPGGVLAVQVPDNSAAPSHRAILAVADRPRWRNTFSGGVGMVYESAETYYRRLAPLDGELGLWETVYYHLMPSIEAILEWHRGTQLRAYMCRLSTEAGRDFEAEVTEALVEGYRPQPDGTYLFTFNRIFFTLEKPE